MNAGVRALVWSLVLALALAPATTVPRAVTPEPVSGDHDLLDLSARFPVLLDASTRTLAPAHGERTLPRAQRRPLTPRRQPSLRCASAPRALPRALTLPELGRRQSDGG